MDYCTFGNPHGTHMIHSVLASQVRRAFWDRFEIEAMVESFNGDVLIQIDCEMNTMTEPKWNFAATDNRDSASLTAMISRTKSYHVRVHTALYNEVHDWLKANCIGRFGIERTQYGTEDEVFINDEAEAVHFKMKWFGQNPEENEAV